MRARVSVLMCVSDGEKVHSLDRVIERYEILVVPRVHIGAEVLYQQLDHVQIPC